MKVTCISASNVIGKKTGSASTKACQMIAEMVAEKYGDQVETDIVSLIDHELHPCNMCGDCVGKGRCAHDQGFNDVFDRMAKGDALFFVVPHYAPIPSKLVILFEKMEEIVYLHYLNDKSYVFPLRRKPAGVIGHGGCPEQYVKTYKTALVDPVSNVLRSCGVEIVGVDDEWPNGVAFAIADLRKPDDSIFPIIGHDWETIRQRVEPLVEKVIAKIM